MYIQGKIFTSLGTPSASFTSSDPNNRVAYCYCKRPGEDKMVIPCKSTAVVLSNLVKNI